MYGVAHRLRKAYVVARTLLSLDRNTRRWHAMRGSLAGKRVFLVGNGPSLNVTPLYLLKGEITVCFNRFYLMHERLAWRPYFYMCVDKEVLPDISDDINAHASEYRWICLHEEHAQGVERRENVLLLNTVLHAPRFSTALPLYCSGGTVAYAALQMLLYLGASEIILVGVDQNYVIHTTAKTTSGIMIQSQRDDDPNHFDPRYFGAGRRYHQPVPATQEKMITAFTRAKEVADAKAVRILNAGVGGELEVYPRVPFESLFAADRTTQYALLAEGIDPACSPDRLRGVIGSETPLTENEIVDAPGLFTVDRSTASKVTTRLVMEYVPFGPIDDRVLFIRRSERARIIQERLL